MTRRYRRELLYECIIAPGTQSASQRATRAFNTVIDLPWFQLYVRGANRTTSCQNNFHDTQLSEAAGVTLHCDCA